LWVRQYDVVYNPVPEDSWLLGSDKEGLRRLEHRRSRATLDGLRIDCSDDVAHRPKNLLGGIMAQIGGRIRKLREERGFTQGDVERCTGMLRAYISRVEHGHTVPSLESIERFAGFFDLPLHEMFREPGENGSAPHTLSGEEPFLTLLAGYVRKMDTADRDVLVALASRLAGQGRADETTRNPDGSRAVAGRPRNGNGSRVRQSI
jgi:transcriptional regulator with XRE-family HTH domain